MQFRYKNGRGKVATLPDVASLLDAIESGAITAESPLAVGAGGSWQRAGSVAAYEQAIAGLSRASGGRRMPGPADRAGSDAPSPGPEVPWQARPNIRLGLGAAAVVLVVTVGYLRIRHLDSERASETARAVIKASGPSLEAQHALSVMTTEFGDSVGLAIRRVQDWFDAQRLGPRIRGRSLKNPASLRILRAAAARVTANAGSLVAQRGALAEVLKSRADSLEVGNSRYDGLSVRLDEALELWRKDIDQYADLDRGVAATLDSVAGFFLDRQRSFALKEGQPVFLSRVDASRFHDFRDQLRVLANRRKAWANGMFSRRPAWMAGIPDSSRPRFEGPMFRAP